MKLNLLNQLRETNPLVHNITNIVVANYSANGLLAIGASPIMADATPEMSQLPPLCQAVVINIGTLSEPLIESMLIAGKTANQHNVPVVLDPVGVGATTFRQQTVKRLLAEIQFNAIRGNAGEMAYLAGVDWQAKGVDAGEGNADFADIAKKVATKYQCIAAVSGETDYLSDGNKVIKIHNGTPLFPKITGSGCLLSAVCGAFLGIAKKGEDLTACVNACTAYAVAGEIAAKGLSITQTGQFYIGFLDSLAALTNEQVQQYARVDDE